MAQDFQAAVSNNQISDWVFPTNSGFIYKNWSENRDYDTIRAHGSRVISKIIGRRVGAAHNALIRPAIRVVSDERSSWAFLNEIDILVQIIDKASKLIEKNPKQRILVTLAFGRPTLRYIQTSYATDQHLKRYNQAIKNGF